MTKGFIFYWLNACLYHWACEQPPAATHTLILLSILCTGFVLISVLVLFIWLVLSSREKQAKKTLSIQKTVKNTNENREKDSWMSLEEMQHKIGIEAVRQSKTVRTRPCRFTGNNEDPYKEYYITNDFAISSKEDLTTGTFETNMEATEAVLNNLTSASLDPGDASWTPGRSSVIKSEGNVAESALSELQKQIGELKADPRKPLRLFQDYLTESKTVQAACAQTKYTESLLTDTKKHIAKLSSVVKIFDTLVVQAEATNDNEFPKLVSMMGALKKEHESLDEWAVKFGVKVVAKGSKRKKAS